VFVSRAAEFPCSAEGGSRAQVPGQLQAEEKNGASDQNRRKGEDEERNDQG
jgi:hypothetical protein